MQITRGIVYMELLEVLNENGIPTGEILDKNKVHKEGKYHKEVALILLNKKGEILLQKRSSTKEKYDKTSTVAQIR